MPEFAPMRKGQVKILERAKHYGYSDACIQLLSRTDLSLKVLEQLSHSLYYCRMQNDSRWLNLYLQLIEKEDIGYLIRRYIMTNEDVSYEDLKKMETADQLCSFFSVNDVHCESLIDVEFIMKFGYSEHTNQLLKIAHRLYDEYIACTLEAQRWRIEWEYWNKIKVIVQRYSDLSDHNEIWDNISLHEWNGADYYLEDYIKNYFDTHIPFHLKTSQGLPKEIRDLFLYGYSARIQVKGNARFVGLSSKAMSFSVTPYYCVEIDTHGNFYVKSDSKKGRTILFFHDTQEFLTAFNTQSGNKYRPTTLRDLYSSISISEDEEDIKNAESVIDYLCNRYQTFIFRDLYDDFLSWNCLLLPISIVEAAKYHSKKELFQAHYKMPISGDWNKKNANLSYLILKLHKRLSADGLARAMQCTNTPFEKIQSGRSQFRFVRMLYSTVHQQISPILLDALEEEYKAKQIHLLPETQTLRAHNLRQYQRKLDDTPEVAITEDTKFKKLIEEMPTEYELIRTRKRICEEAEMQHNCVASYASSISQDLCMIYSILYQNERHTIEIVRTRGRDKYAIRQCYRSCNRLANPSLLATLNSEIERINQIRSE